MHDGAARTITAARPLAQQGIRTMPQYRLISFDMCPFVQRTQVMLREKGVDFTVDYVDLSDKPDWFLELSPTGKVPTLEVTTDDGERVVLFESLVINEYLEEAAGGRDMYPQDPLHRAHARAWTEFSTALLEDCFALTAAADREALDKALARVRDKLDRLEREVGAGPFFLGDWMSLVDAAFVPALQRLKFTDELDPGLGLFGERRPNVTRWWQSIEARPSVPPSAPQDVRERFYRMIGRDRGGYRSLIGARVQS